MNAEKFQVVERAIENAGVMARYIADTAITDFACYYTAMTKEKQCSNEASRRYGHFQGETDALSWMLGYQTEEEYSDMNSALFDFIQERGKELARRNLAMFA